ncbi:MAG: 30S ribosome-binding factor RbfA [Chloroflexi bacterium]|nr:30S ribosome-binding factor RbfA [Chloroflexota bacterium]
MGKERAGRRRARLNVLLREEISLMLQREIKDPRLSRLITIIAAEISPDLAQARVYVSVMGTANEKQESLAALQHAKGFFRRELGDRIRLRRSPELNFLLDESLERGDHIIQQLREL